MTTPSDLEQPTEPIPDDSAAGRLAADQAPQRADTIPAADASSAPEETMTTGSTGNLAEEPDTDMATARQSPAASADPGPPEQAQPASPARPQDRQFSAGRTLSRVSLGGAAIGLDALRDQLAQIEVADAEEEAPPGRTLDQVLIPRTDWEQQFGESPDVAARHLLMGAAADARARANRSLGLLDRAGRLIARTLEPIFSPIFRSRTARPIRRQFDAAVNRGQSQVDRWMALGRAADSRNQRLAQRAINRVAEESMDELVDNPRVQVFIQEVVQAQSQGFINEAIEEVRERTISGDDFLEQPARGLLRRPPRPALPPPSFPPERAWRSHRPLPPGYRQTRLGHYAGFISRFLAFVIDLVVLVALLSLMTWVVTQTVALLGLQDYFRSLLDADNLVGVIGSLLVTFNGVFIVIGYFLALWMLTGQTIGMMLMGLRVVSRDGGPVSFGRALFRWIGLLLSAAALFLGIMWLIGDDKRQGWHDKLAGTVVVYSWDAKPDETFLTEFAD